MHRPLMQDRWDVTSILKVPQRLLPSYDLKTKKISSKSIIKI